MKVASKVASSQVAKNSTFVPTIPYFSLREVIELSSLIALFSCRCYCIQSWPAVIASNHGLQCLLQPANRRSPLRFKMQASKKLTVDASRGAAKIAINGGSNRRLTAGGCV